MNHIIFRIGSYIRHNFRSMISKRGYGVHSPFAFHLITNIINPESPSHYYCFKRIEQLRAKSTITEENVKLTNSRPRPLGSIAQTSSSPARDGQLIMRIALHMKAQNIIELGTSLGFGTAYLASSNSKANITSIDYEKDVQDIAKRHLKELSINNVTLINESFSVALQKVLEQLKKIDLVFFDGNHKGQATETYFHNALPYTHDHSIFIFHDIHWSKDMHKSWLNISKNPQVSITIECYNLGIVFFNPEYQKQHFYA